MIQGIVESSEIRVPVKIGGATGQEVDLQAVLDTGFTGHLTLPADVIQHLNLEWVSVARGALADGSFCFFDVFEARVRWVGAWLTVVVHASDSAALVGMALLDGYELTAEVCQHGKVLIRPLAENSASLPEGQ